MRNYKAEISLSKNERGIWDLDTIKGCKSGLDYTQNGCYGDCYAYKTAKRYGINFYNSVNRHFIDEFHRSQIVRQIEKIDMPFIRIGCAGDPSEDWQHTIDIIEKIRTEKQLSLFDISSKKQIVIITRHWNKLTQLQLETISKYNICINTSISALDDESMVKRQLGEYNRLKQYCKSILRVVTCEFNLENEIGRQKNDIQKTLIAENGFIDTVFRPSKNNPYLINGVIIARKMGFMNSKSLISKNNKKAYTGKCKNCLEMCGLNN